MGLSVVAMVLGAVTSLCLDLAVLGLRTGESAAYFFAASGLLFGIFFFTAIRRLCTRKGGGAEQIDVQRAGVAAPASFVPHWFMMAAILVAAIGIAVAMFIPKFFR